uniref:Senescence regulator n=1 Tax=Davidia involucrata TaxID=16924 RepID=A0A5B7ARQ9_DAVIN
MDPSGGGATRFRLRKTPSSDRFLGVFSHSKSETAVSGAGDELTEDDVFWTGYFAEHNHSANSPSTSANRDHHRHAKGFGRPENFGILAALPVTESDQNFQTRSVFNHRASVSSSSSSSSASSSRMIPTVPKKPPLDRPSSVKYHQSAPVNVPMLSDAMRRNREIHEFDDIDVDDDEADGEMLPPHEIVDSKQSPMVAFSVLEGVGRTLKGRDLRQVRNAVWRKTGFLD